MVRTLKSDNPILKKNDSFIIKSRTVPILPTYFRLFGLLKLIFIRFSFRSDNFTMLYMISTSDLLLLQQKYDYGVY